MKTLIRSFIKSIDVSVFFVFKKNKKLRFCVNYREFNKISRKNQYSLSLITQMLNQLNECKFFIKFNFRNVYHKIKIRKKK